MKTRRYQADYDAFMRIWSEMEQLMDEMPPGWVERDEALNDQLCAIVDRIANEQSAERGVSVAAFYERHMSGDDTGLPPAKVFMLRALYNFPERRQGGPRFAGSNSYVRTNAGRPYSGGLPGLGRRQ
jgi:hypothetical protein